MRYSVLTHYRHYRCVIKNRANNFTQVLQYELSIFNCKTLDKSFGIWYIYIAMKEKFQIDKFASVYKGTINFCDTAYFKAFYDSLDDETLFQHILFNNDVMNIPPIFTFVKLRQSLGDELFLSAMSKTDKRCLGACFGYLFKYILGYDRPVPVWVGEKATGIKNASYFVKEFSHAS